MKALGLAREMAQGQIGEEVKDFDPADPLGQIGEMAQSSEFLEEDPTILGLGRRYGLRGGAAPHRMELDSTLHFADTPCPAMVLIVQGRLAQDALHRVELSK